MDSNHGPPRGYLMKTFFGMILYAIRHSKSPSQDLPFLLTIFAASLQYIWRFVGLLSTPVGKCRITNQESMRAFTYGIFKTRFCYLRKLAELLPGKPGFTTVVDVGANLGDFTLAMAKYCDRIVSVEPGIANFNELCSNIKINSLEGVIPLNVAAHDSAQELALNGNNSDLWVSEFGDGQKVMGIPLDRIILSQGIELVDLIKIDVQGHEIAVLKGMTEILNGHQARMVIVEVHIKR